MNSNIYKQIRQKVINNIEIIYNNKIISDELRKVYDKYPSLEVLREEAISSGAFTGSTAYLEDIGEIYIDPIKSLDEFISLMLHGSIAANFYGETRYPYEKEADLLRKIIGETNNPFIAICKKIKLNPSIWKNIVIAKFLEIPQKTVLSFIDNIIEFQYLPKVKILDEKIMIEINELTTIEEIKLIWKKIKSTQREFEENNNFINQKRKYQTLDRGKMIEELSNKLNNSEISKIINKNGEKVIGYEYISKIKKAHNKKFLER